MGEMLCKHRMLARGCFTFSVQLEIMYRFPSESSLEANEEANILFGRFIQ
jgi:hypothetical protein